MNNHPQNYVTLKLSQNLFFLYGNPNFFLKSLSILLPQHKAHFKSIKAGWIRRMYEMKEGKGRDYIPENINILPLKGLSNNLP
jgi:hypothetical protein